MSDSTPDDIEPATAEAEAAEAQAVHNADRPPTEEEGARAEALEADPSVAEHFEEMNRIGAEVKGEGEIK